MKRKPPLFSFFVHNSQLCLMIPSPPLLTPCPPPWECRGLLRLGHSPLLSLSRCLSLCPLPAWLCGGMAGQGEACDGRQDRLLHQELKRCLECTEKCSAHTSFSSFFFNQMEDAPPLSSLN